MTTKEIKIYKTEDGRIPYLSDLIETIPTNTIFCKTLTGLGATFTEIKSKRHSIIVEPNVSTIQSKEADSKHADDNICAVYGERTVDSIVKYITESNGKYLKFLTTPESFHKIKNAFNDLDMLGVMYYECFMLFDECHKIIKDADYRKTMQLPLSDFFKFKNKALVSATPIELSDERFNDFTKLIISPQFDFRQPLTVEFTNNTLAVIREVFANIGDNTVCIFLNSTDAIHSLINTLNIGEETTVFCSEDSVAKLNSSPYKFKRAFSTFDKNQMTHYNFFTSRFYAGMDIVLDYKPDLVMFSDMYLVSHTMLDPHTDIPQIIGRFRKGVNSAIHITNAVTNHEYQSKEDILTEIRVLEGCYERDKREYETATELPYKRAYKRQVDSSDYRKLYLDDEGNKVYSAIDNYVNDNLTKNMYLNIVALQSEYMNNPMLIKRFDATIINKRFRTGDFERLTIKRKKSTISKRKAITEMWDKFYPIQAESDSEFVEMCRKEDKIIVEALELTSTEKVRATKYYAPKLRELIREAKSISPHVTELVRDYFHVGQKYTLPDIKSKLKEIYAKCGVPPQGVTAQTLKKYFICSNTSIKGKEALLIMGDLP